jgi:hypothetical protein
MEPDWGESLFSYRPADKLAAAAIFGDVGLRFVVARKGPLNSSTLSLPSRPALPNRSRQTHCIAVYRRVSVIQGFPLGYALERTAERGGFY